MAANMVWCEGEYYSVYTKGGIPNAIATDKDEMTLDECRKLIDERNAWAHGNAAAADIGCKPTQFAIVKHTWNRGVWADGTFFESNRKDRVVEIYPAEI